MKKKQQKIWYIALLIACLCLLALIWFFVSDNAPGVIVGSSFISKIKLNENTAIDQKLNPGMSDSDIYNQIIKIKKEQELTWPSSADIDAELKFDTTGKDMEYSNLLKDYFNNDQNQFVEYVVRPLVYDAKLRIEYNSDLSANLTAYNRAKGVLVSLNNGEPFEDVAKAESDDKVTGQLGGDLGFVVSGQILPEVAQVLMKVKVGEVYKQIITTRLGYMIIYPIETADKNGQKIWHLKQILIQTTGFDDWLNNQLNGFFVWRVK